MTPDEFLQSFVDGNLGDCRAEPGSLRRAFNAAVSASHLADHFFEYHKRHNSPIMDPYPKLRDFIEHLVETTGGAFRDLRSISNAYKHLYTDQRHPTRSAILSGGALISVSEIEKDDAVAQIDDEWVDGGNVGGSRSFVQFTRRDGTKGEFLPILEAFVELWYRDYAWQDGQARGEEGR